MKLLPALQSLAAVMRIPISSRRIATVHNSRTVSQPRIDFQSHAFSTSQKSQAKASGRPKRDPRISTIRYHLFHPLTPRPLRLSRLRTLRHWTIHRAAQLLLHKERKARERDLERQYNSMRAAMEELRLGMDDGGRLYRQAADRKGIYGGLKVGETASIVGNGGVPIEYSRAQTEGPPKNGWDGDWKRA